MTKKKNHIARLAGVTILIALMGCTVASCSLKESRAECPCYLDVTLAGGHIPDAGEPLSVYGKGSVHAFKAAITTDDCMPAWEKAVQHDEYSVLGWHGSTRNLVGDYAIAVPTGEQFDSLFCCRTDVDATGDLAEAELRFHKEYTTVSINMGKTPQQMERYRFLVTGSTVGVSLYSGAVIEGTYSFEPTTTGDDAVVHFRVPRQNRSDLKLGIWYRADDGTYWKIDDYILGKYLEKAGYDWAEEDLRDVEITLGLVVGQIVINVAGWERGYVFDLVEF